MKRFTLYALLLCLFLTTFAYANITLNGESVHVETDSYAVQFDKGVITHIHNKLTDETYTIGATFGTTELEWNVILSFRESRNKAFDGVDSLSLCHTD